MATTPIRQEMPGLDEPVIRLRGVGPERGMQLSRLEIHTIRDLLLHRPLRYEDRRRLIPIAELAVGQPATVKGKIVAQGIKWARKRTKSIFEFIITDGTARLYCRWWNLPFMEKFFAVGDEVIVFGKPLLLKPRTMDHPDTEVVDPGDEDFVHFNRITPVYPLTDGLPQRWVRALIWRTLEDMDLPAQLAAGGAAGDPAIVARARAIRMLHFPETKEDALAAVRRLALEEFIELQRGIQARRRNLEKNAEGLPCGGNNRLMRPFLAALGFKLTAAQTAVLRTLRQDLSAAHPMRRLLQGDVGSGKTVVAACCALMTLESGYNAALMAPTEILAEQHYQNFKKWFAPLGIAVEIRTGSRKSDGAAPGEAVASGRAGMPALYVGTHALIQKQFAPENLGLVIIDEQHRFGVEQREEFLRKGRYPHLLVMTATPIPRTLGLTLYGDLDVSVIDALPPGRGRIKTFVRASDRLPKVWDFIRAELAKGRQAYVVYPRVEESAAGVKAVTTERANLERVFTGHGVGLMHGRLASSEKEAAMAAFRSGTTQVLLATSLIEVGVDVPNATVMLIENAEQFGLAQLHQLRGRIGRGAHESYCILLANAKTDEAQARLRILEQTDDGFRIAEEDLKLRGPGELLGQKQSGLPRFRFGNLLEDRELIEEARRLVRARDCGARLC
jgi:ATP-dependent DNA helicase RecG